MAPTLPDRLVHGFDHWTLSVSDLERSTEFYEHVLGWRVDDAPELGDDASRPVRETSAGRARSRRFVRDGQRIELCAPATGSWHTAPSPQVNHLGLSHVTVATGPTDDTLAALRARGVHVREHTRSSFVPGLEEPGNQFLFEDPDGNIIETFEADDDWNPFGDVGLSDPTSGNTFGIAHLSHWSLCIADPATALPFYERVLGWERLSTLPWEGPGPSTVMDVGPANLTTWLYAAGDQRIEIIHFAEPGVVARPHRGNESTGLSHMTVLVDEDVDAVVAALREQGTAAHVVQSGACETVEFADPDGNLIRGIPSPRAGSSQAT